LTNGEEQLLELISLREVNRVLHYTCEKGVMGAIRLGALLSRQRAEQQSEVSFIFEGIWPRKDPEWVDHISLSLTKPNTDLFARSRQRFPDYWWALLEFEPEILADPGVVFTTTNNVYPPCERAEGAEGFEAMFATEVVWGHYETTARRREDYPENLPTHEAAEVLYPASIPLTRLRRVIVPAEPHRRMIAAWCDAFGHPAVSVDVDPSLY
jgi:hypothetical protein